MAASSFCNTSHCSGFKKLKESLLGRHNNNRSYQLSSFPDVAQRPLCSELCFNQSNIRQLNSMRVHRGSWLKCRAEYANTSFEEKEENISKATLIWRAIKLPMYTVALIPLTVGSAAAYLQTGQYCSMRYIRLLVSSVLIIAWLNLSNDIHDFDKGADKNKKESVVNLVGSRTGIHIFACLLLALGAMGGAWVSVETGSLRSVLLLFCAVFCGYIYQCPPFRLGYLGLGEPLCFAAFGPFATTAFYLLQSGKRLFHFNKLPDLWYKCLIYLILASALMVGSYQFQVEDDKAVGKFSPLVRLGTEAGAKVVKVAVMVLYSLLFILGLSQVLPFSCVVMGALTLPAGKLVAGFVEENHKDKSKIFMAKYYCVRLHALFGVALSAGLVAARIFVRKQLPHAIVL